MEEITTYINEAKFKLESAESKFNNSIKNEDIDVAIAEMNAAEKRLNRLICLAKGAQ